MAGSKEIRTKIKSVQNTRKITKAMEMVAASKMRKAQERMRAARPYGEKIRNVAAHISHANPEYRHPFLVRRDTVKKVGIIIITTDKGLCGGLNTNVQRLAMNKMKEWEEQGESFEVCCIGNKGLGFMQRLGANVVSQVTGLGDRPQMDKLIGAVKVMLDAYREGRIDRLFLVSTMIIAAIAVLGLNLLTGFNGQISLGHGAFYAVGAYTAAILMDKLNFPYHASILMGYPGEREEDIQATFDFLEKAKPPIVGVNWYVPLPGSPDYDRHGFPHSSVHPHAILPSTGMTKSRESSIRSVLFRRP